MSCVVKECPQFFVMPIVLCGSDGSYRVTTAVDPVPHIPMDSFVHPRGEI